MFYKALAVNSMSVFSYNDKILKYSVDVELMLMKKVVFPYFHILPTIANSIFFTIYARIFQGIAGSFFEKKQVSATCSRLFILVS